MASFRGPNMIDNNEVPPKQNVKAPDREAEMAEEEACFSPPLNGVDEKLPLNPLATEFVPEHFPNSKSYAKAPGSEPIAEENVNQKLCRYTSKNGICRNLTDCTYLHAELCDMCCRFILHPYNENQRNRHRQECIKQHEKNVELSFSVARSKDISCTICLEVVMEKAIGQEKFGILPNCNHCFCLTCIQIWRQERVIDNRIVRACPECNVTSNFVCPSKYWVDTKEDKEKLISDYKNELSRKDCKYFKKGLGKCFLGSNCFYSHAFPDGTICNIDPSPGSLGTKRRNGRNNIWVFENCHITTFI